MDVSFCHDPDADRPAVINKSGRCLAEQHTLILCVDRGAVFGGEDNGRPVDPRFDRRDDPLFWGPRGAPAQRSL